MLWTTNERADSQDGDMSYPVQLARDRTSVERSHTIQGKEMRGMICDWLNVEPVEHAGGDG